MLKEMSPIRQIANEGRRRWFTSKDCDLIVWLSEDDAVAGFQFCYQKADQEHALSWIPPAGFSHAKVDCGGGSNPAAGLGTPFLVATEYFEPDRILATFRAECGALPQEYVDLVAGKLTELLAQENKGV